MATATELEQMTQRARDHRDHGDIPQNEWHDMTRAAEAAFARDRAAFGGSDPAARAAGRVLDREQRTAMDLARQMAVSAPGRDNPFGHDELRRAFESERAYARTLDTRYERAADHDRRIGRGDDFAGDAWRDRETGEVRHVAVGHDPNAAELQAERRVSNAEWNRAVTNAELAIEARQIAEPGAADPVLQMGMKIPASQQFHAYETADQLAHSEDGDNRLQSDIERAEPGRTYTGKVVEVTANHVFQEVGDRTIAHDRQALTGRSFSRQEDMRGQQVEIRYPHGRVGLVREAGQSRELAGAQKDMQKDYGTRER